MKILSAFLVLSVLLASCKGGDEQFIKGVTADSAVAGNREGFAGVMDVPEMLCLSITDSASMENVSKKIAANYVTLLEEMDRIGAIADGPAGQISYNNNPANFKFECIQLIKEMPPKQPVNCSIVVLEASRMLIYNYYGPYNNLYQAYKKMDEYCKAHHLSQTGPQREFYVTDPTAEPDETKWLTRVMLPVREEIK